LRLNARPSPNPTSPLANLELAVGDESARHRRLRPSRLAARAASLQPIQCQQLHTAWGCRTWPGAQLRAVACR